ncbi:MAG: hypothetical protein ACJAT1_001071 [Marivirga sp.]|jgi:hypothetical protein
MERPAEVNPPIASEAVSIKVPAKNEAGNTPTAETKEDLYKGVELDPTVSEHDSRYFFAPSARPLKKGELYYNMLYFLIHDVQYGISDRLSVGLGTTVIGLPFYVTTKYAIPIDEKSYFAIGDLLILGTYGVDFIGNLLFASYTYGSDQSNITFGAGMFTSNDRDFTANRFSFVGNINGMLSVGKYF